MTRRTFFRLGGLAAGWLFAPPPLRSGGVRAEPIRVLQIATSEAFGAAHLVVDAAGPADRPVAPSGLRPYTTYFWRVAFVRDGRTGSWSETASFTTRRVVGAEPVPVRLATYPFDGGYLAVLQAGSLSQTRRVPLPR